MMKYSDAINDRNMQDRGSAPVSSGEVKTPPASPAASAVVSSPASVAGAPLSTPTIKAEPVTGGLLESQDKAKTVTSQSSDQNVIAEPAAKENEKEYIEPTFATERTQRAERDDKRIRSEQEAKPKDTYYRPEYGWIMSDAQVAEEEKIKFGSEENAKQYAAQIKAAEGKYQTALAEAEAKVDKLYADAMPKKWTPPGTTLKTYSMPENIDSNNSYENPDNGNLIDDGITSIDSVLPDSVRATMEEALIEKGYAQTDSEGNITTISSLGYQTIDAYQKAYNEDLADALKNNQKLYAASVKALAKEKEAALKGIKDAAEREYNTQKAIWTADLARLNGAYSDRVAAGKAAYEDSRKKFNDSVLGVNSGLLETPTNMVNPGA